MLSRKDDSMSPDGHLNFDTKINESGFSAGIKKLGSIAKGGLKILGGAVAGVTAAMGAGIAAGVKYNAGIEQYQTSFEVMTGSADKAAEVIERLKKVGAETPFELNDLADVTQLLMNYGFTEDGAMDKMMMLGNISQGSADKMNRIATAYGQMSSAGKVSLEDVKQMIEAGFNPLQEISENTGESMASLYDRISKGTITVDEITASMQRATSEGGKYFQSMEKQSQTVNGLISTLKDNAQQLLGEVVKPISDGFAKDILPGAISALEQLTKAFKENGTEGLIEAGGKIITDLLLGIANKLPGMLDTAVQVIQSLIQNLDANLPQLVTAGGKILTSLIGGIVSLLPSLGDLALDLILQIANGITANAPQMIPKGVKVLLSFISGIVDNLPKLLEAGLNMIVALAEGVINSLPTLIEQVPKIINAFFDSLDSFLPKVLLAGVKLLIELGKGIIQSIPTIIANAGEIVKAILNVVTHFSLFSQGKSLIKGMGEGIKSVFGNISSIIKKLIERIKNPFKIDWGSIGKNIVQGIANGLKNGAGAIVDAAKGAAKSALSAAKNFLGIHSPSTVFRDQVGKYMAEGMGIGFKTNMPVDEMEKSIGKAVDKVQNAVSAVSSEAVKTSGGVTGDHNDTSNDDKTIIVENNNTFIVDSTPLVEKTTKATIKRIGTQQKNSRIYKGK